MKTTRLKLVTLLMIVLELCSCSFGASYHAQLTSMNIGCNADEVKTSNEIYMLNQSETWTATCNGKTYDCDYYPDGDDSHCYLRDQ